jgi:hypothetical protein
MNVTHVNLLDCRHLLARYRSLAGRRTMIEQIKYCHSLGLGTLR